MLESIRLQWRWSVFLNMLASGPLKDAWQDARFYDDVSSQALRGCCRLYVLGTDIFLFSSVILSTIVSQTLQVNLD